MAQFKKGIEFEDKRVMKSFKISKNYQARNLYVEKLIDCGTRQRSTHRWVW